MKKLATRLTIIAMSVLFTTHYLPSCTFNKDGEREYENESEEGEEREAGVEKEMMSWFQSRGYPNPYYMESKYMAAWEQAQKLKEQSSNIYSRVQGGSNWASLGPSTGIGGRILSIAIDPANNNNLFAGSASGGIWKSTNGGTSWSHVNCNLPVLGVPAIIIDPSNSNVIYAGTGEVYRFDSTSGTPNPGNTGYSVWKTRGTYGIGVIKSTDGGVTWSQVFTKNTAQLFGIQSLKFDPSNSNTVYACTTQGLYRSTNAGTTWSNILDLTYISDVVINGTSIVAAVGNLQNTMKGIYKSTNSGTTWTKITSGLPASFLGSVKMDWVSSDPNTIMASFGVSEVSNVKELYRSTDFGTTWSALSNSTHTQWQYWCAHVVAINPSNTNKLVFGGVKLKNYTVSTSTAGSALTIHDDIHDIKFDPSNANNVYAACDGGIYKSTNGGTSFTAINNGLAATQFYATIGVSPTNANVIVGGLQDNGVVMTTNGGTTWTTYPGSYGDGASCAIDPTNGNKILSSGDARKVYLSINGGSSTSSNSLDYLGGANDSRTAFNSPLTFAKGKPSIVYVGSDNLHKSTDGGNSFSGGSGTPGTSYIEALHKTALTISVDPLDATGNLLYASTSPFAQYDNDVDNLYVTGQPNILKSTNGGATLPMTSVKGSLPDRFVLDITFSPTYHDSVYITLGGFGTSHIYVTPDGGTTWHALGASLPDVPFNTLIFDPVNPKIIYAGCDLGVYVSADRGLTWQDFNTGFWDATEVVDLQIDANKKLIAATHGKGIFRSDLFTQGTLPVTLISFDGVNKTAFNQLHWTVAQEDNLRSYELERSSDGIHYSSITSISARNSLSQTSYSYDDPVNRISSEYYYRLKMINTDGSFSYSAVIFIRVVVKDKFWIVQNPVYDYILLQYNMAQDERLKIAFMNSLGQMLRKEEYAATAGTGTYALYGIEKFPAGTYFLRIEGKTEQQTIRVIKN